MLVEGRSKMVQAEENIIEGLERLLRDVQIAAVVCNQFGDTGKGKFSDLLAQYWADVIARGTGGANAGHSVVIDGKTRVFHLLPAGMTYDKRGVVNIMGNGMVIDPFALNEELDDLVRSGGSYNNLMISQDAHVILPFQIDYDKAKDQSQRDGGIGSTGRGIGPAYTDKIARRGIMVRHLLDKDTLATRLGKLQTFYPDINIEKIVADLGPVTERLRPMVRDTVNAMHGFIASGKKIGLEGAQSLLLSIEHGVYPYSTSSDCSVNGTASGVGISAKAIDLVLAICKFPFMSKVGGGPFPTEFGGRKSEEYCAATEVRKDGEKVAKFRAEVEKSMYPQGRDLMNDADEFMQGVGIRMAAGEYGATTGRPRRPGWTDAVAARYASGINGPMKLVLTKVDCLAGINEFKICYGYRTPSGGRSEDFVRDAGFLRSVTPEYRTYRGYGDIRDARSVADLPEDLQQAIREFGEFARSPIGAISIGPEANQTIIV